MPELPVDILPILIIIIIRNDTGTAPQHWRNGMTISISLEQYGDRGWEWTVTGVDICGDTVREHCRTNRQGEGLWNVGSYTGTWAENYEDKQIMGTCQFELPANRKAAYAKIRREFMRDHGLLREQW